MISFLSPSDVESRFPGSNTTELSGIDGFESKVIDGKTSLVVKTDIKNLNQISRLVLAGISKEPRTISSVIRDASLLSAAITSELPIVCEKSQITLKPTPTHVSEVATYLAHRTFQKLALPKLRAYHAEDILEARLKLKGELAEFKAGIRDLVWLLDERNDLSGNLRGIGHHCDVLIETKITAAILSLEQAMAKHENQRIRRILKRFGTASVEIVRSNIVPSIAGALIGESSALMKLSESMEARAPNIQIASFVYRARERKF